MLGLYGEKVLYVRYLHDSILIDEARTPLIISGQGQESTDIYKKADACVKSLIRGEDAKDLTKIESIMDNMENRELTQEELDKKGDYTVNEKDGTYSFFCFNCLMKSIRISSTI